MTYSSLESVESSVLESCRTPRFGPAYLNARNTYLSAYMQPTLLEWLQLLLPSVSPCLML